jgi:hypothetical protein
VTFPCSAIDTCFFRKRNKWPQSLAKMLCTKRRSAYKADFPFFIESNWNGYNSGCRERSELKRLHQATSWTPVSPTLYFRSQRAQAVMGP